MRFRTLFDLLRERVESAPQRVQYRFVEPSRDAETITCGVLWHAASTVAAQLIGAELAGQPVLLACTTARHAVVGVHACVLAAAVTVLAPPPGRPGCPGCIRHAAAATSAALVLADTDAAVADSGRLDVPVLDLRVALAAGPARFEPRRWPAPPAGGATPAWRTVAARGPQRAAGRPTSHADVLEQCAGLAGAARHPAAGTVTSWPMRDDADLVAAVFAPLYLGCEGTFVAAHADTAARAAA